MTPATPDLSSVLQRLEKVERNYLLMSWGVALLALFIGIALLRMNLGASSRVLDTGGFVVKDVDGTVRARVGFFEKDSFFNLYDADGELQVGLTATPRGPLLNFYDTNGKARGVLGTNQNDTYLFLYDAEAKEPRARLTTTK